MGTRRSRSEPDGPEDLPSEKRSGKGNGVTAAPSPKNRTGGFPHIRLKPFLPPVLPDAVFPRRVPGYALAGGTWDEAAPGCLPYLIPLWIARGYDGYAIL